MSVFRISRERAFGVRVLPNFLFRYSSSTYEGYPLTTGDRAGDAGFNVSPDSGFGISVFQAFGSSAFHDIGLTAFRDYRLSGLPAFGIAGFRDCRLSGLHDYPMREFWLL
jgi:hypothetical protein